MMYIWGENEKFDDHRPFPSSPLPMAIIFFSSGRKILKIVSSASGGDISIDGGGGFTGHS